MITNNNFSVLPWYSSLREQNHYKKYAYSQIYPLKVPANRLVPFQLLLESVANLDISTYRIYVHDLDGTTVGANRIESFIKSGLSLYTTDKSTWSVIMFSASSDLEFTLPFGQYYLTISDGINTWYSDVFTVTDITDCVKLQWWDNADFIMEEGLITYANGFKNILYVSSDIGKPKYQYEEEGDDRDGLFFAEKQLSEKVYNFVFVGPEYICDATRFIRLADNVVIEQDKRTYKCSNVIVEVDWQEQGDLAAISIEFKIGQVAKKIAPGFDDYSQDYNTDYNN